MKFAVCVMLGAFAWRRWVMTTDDADRLLPGTLEYQ